MTIECALFRLKRKFDMKKCILSLVIIICIAGCTANKQVNINDTLIVHENQNNIKYKSIISKIENEDIKNCAIRLQSTNSRVQRRYAQMIYHHYPENVYLLKVVNGVLLDEYTKKLRDKQHRDAMAWLCRILGNSYDKEYIATLKRIIYTECCSLDEVYSNSKKNKYCTAIKIKRYAKSSLKILKLSLGINE